MNSELKPGLDLLGDPIVLTQRLVDIPSPSGQEKQIADEIEDALRNLNLPGVEVFRFNNNVRTNTTVTEPDGTTTKLNGPGAPLSEQKLRSLEKVLIDALRPEVTWVVLAGSLPPGAPLPAETPTWRSDFGQDVLEIKSHCG